MIRIYLFPVFLASLTMGMFSLNAQVIQSEDFNAGMQPAGWTVTNTGIGGDTIGTCLDGMYVFMYDCTTYPSSSGAPTPPGFSGTVAVIDYDNHPGSVEPGMVACHVSPAVNTTAAASVVLSFDYEHQDFAGEGLFTVEVFDGTIWNQVFSADDDESGSQTINITPFSNTALQVRYCFDTQNESGTLIWGCAIDNHLLEEVACLPPEDLAATSPNSMGATISWTDPNNPPGDSYEIEIVESSNPPTGVPTATNISNPYVWTGATPGVEYDAYVRIQCSGGTSDWSGPVTFLAIDPPVNDLCGSAISVGVGDPGMCGATASGNNTGATDSGEGSPSCGTYAGGDIWYSFTVPASGGVILDVLTEDWTSPYGAIYSGTCGSLAQLDCQLLSTTSNDEFLGLTPGATIYLRLWDSGNNNFGDITFCLEAAPFPPANDNCDDAVVLSVGVSGSCPGAATAGSTVNSTDDGFTSCDATGINNGVWYSFVAPAQGSVFVTIEEVSGNHEAAVFDACGGNELFCSSTPNAFLLESLTPGNTYYLLIWSDAGQEGDHNVCIEEPPMAPANDLCGDAENITVGEVGVCGPTYNGTNIGATDSGESAPSCGSYAGGDIWYAFLAPTNGGVIVDILTEDWTSPYMAIYSGTCGSLTEVYCDIVSTTTDEIVSGLTAGNTYYMRFWDSGNNNFGNISFCVSEIPLPPANDLCSGAEPVTVGIGSCGPTATGNNTSATDSGEGTPGCSSYAGGDIWYVFAAPPSGNVWLDVITETWTSPYISVYSGSCGSLTEVYCNLVSTTSLEDIFGLTPGATYYLRWWDSGNNNFGDISFCLEEAPPPPANDDCENALALVVEAYGDCPGNATTGFTILATDDGFTSCDATGINNGVWYSFVAPTSEVNLLVNEVSGNHEVAIFDACGGNEVFCDISPNNETVTGLTPASTYYLLIWSDAGSEGEFEICIQEPPPVPANDLCGNAEILDAMSVGTFTTSGTTLGATTTDAPAACDVNVDNSSVGGVWYQVNTDDQYDITIGLCNSNYDTEISVYNGSCGSLTCLVSNDDGCVAPNGLGSEVMLPAGTFLQGGDNQVEIRSAPSTLYVYVTGHGSAAGNFTLSVTVEEALPLELISFTGKAEADWNVLNWVTASEQNTEAHIIQRLTNGAELAWETVGKVPAAGNSSSLIEYEWIDISPFDRTGYRIKTVDFDQTEHLSPIVIVYRPPTQIGFQLTGYYPQPMDSRVLFLDVVNPAEAELEHAVYDLQGRLVTTGQQTVKEGASTLQLPLHDLSSGMYFLNLKVNSTSITKKLVVK